MPRPIKMLTATSVIAFGLACAACSTSTAPQQAQLQPVDADGLPILTAEQKEQGIICVNEPVTGTRISKKKCTTPEQRERDKRLAREEAEKVQRKAGPTIFQ